MRLALSLDGAEFSDTALGDLQRAFATVAEPPAAPRERSGRLLRPRRQGAVEVAIFDAEKVNRVLRARGLDPAALGKRLHMERLPSILDYGELRVRRAEKVAAALGVPLTDICIGTRMA